MKTLIHLLHINLKFHQDFQYDKKNGNESNEFKDENEALECSVNISF